MNREMLERYAAIRLTVPGDTAITVLHIGDAQTVVATEACSLMALDIGTHKIAAEFFKHHPPTAIEIETAIVAVEDELARLRTIMPDSSMLFSSDEEIREIARIAGVSDSEMILSRDAVEQTFDRLATVTLGRLMGSAVLPKHPGFYATLLILREFMHHLRFTTLVMDDSQKSAQSGVSGARKAI